MTIFKILCLCVLYLSLSSFSPLNDSLSNPQGKVEEKGDSIVYSFGSGKIECHAQIDHSGRIVALLKPLKENTTIHFSNVSKAPNQEILLTCVLSVKEDTHLCAGWINMQEINIAILPSHVEAITLTGKEVFHSEDLSVLIQLIKK